MLALLRREGTVRIATLAKAFGVTTETARRDLDQLARTGALNRTYGGGASQSLTDEPPIGVRGRVHSAARTRIGAAAAALVSDGDAVMIDCGSTTALFASALAARNLRITVVTNCVPAARMLASSTRCRVILCPGDYVLREGGVYGPDTVAFVLRYRANRAFIGAGGVAADGVTDADSASCAVKRAMIERSDAAVLLADRSKFDAVQFEQVCPLEEIDDLLTDTAPPRRLATALGRAGVRTIVAG